MRQLLDSAVITCGRRRWRRWCASARAFCSTYPASSAWPTADSVWSTGLLPPRSARLRLTGLVSAIGPAAAALRLPGAALKAIVQLLVLEARFAGKSKAGAAAVASVGAPEAAAASGSGEGAAASAAATGSSSTPRPEDANCLRGLLCIAQNAIACLLHSCTDAGGLEHVAAHVGLELQEPAVLRRIVSMTEGPPSLQVPPAPCANLLLSLSGGTDASSSARGAAPPLLVALRRGAGDEALAFCLAGILNLLAPEPAAAAGGASESAETRARRAAVAAVSGAQDGPGSPRYNSGSIILWFNLLSTILGSKSGEPGDEAIRARLLRQAVDGRTASLVLTALEAATLVPGPEVVDYRIVANGLKLLSVLVTGNEQCWREAVFEDAPPASALSMHRPAWAAAAGGVSQPGRAPPWAVSVAVGALKRVAARQPLMDSAWFLSAEDAGAAAVLLLLSLVACAQLFAHSLAF